jgi:hypothetical protein
MGDPIMFNRFGNKPFVPSKIEVELVAHGGGALFFFSLFHMRSCPWNARVGSSWIPVLPSTFGFIEVEVVSLR